MKPHRILFLSILTAGCDWLKPIDPCAQNSPLQQDPSVAADCQQCNQSPCPDETGETGDDDSFDLTCESYGLDGEGHGVQYCYVGNWDIPITNPNLAPYIHKTRGECPQLSGEFPCDRTWNASTSAHAGGNGEQQPPEQLPADGDSAGTMCVLCQTDGGIDGEPWDPASKIPADSIAGWKLCKPDFFYSRPHPATGDDLPGGVQAWLDNLTCDEPSDPGYACPLGHVALDPPTDGDGGFHNGRIMFSSFACRCDGSDATCQPGSVCEAGWEIQGMIPKPTLCVWPDAAPPPSGPAVYGLDVWTDGLDVENDRIMLLPSMLLALSPREGKAFPLLNDDQRVDARGTITRCGAGSLCEHIGLAVGERLVLDRFDRSALLAGKPTYIEVVRPQTRSRWLEISLAI